MKEIVIKLSDETYNECLADEGRLNIIWDLVDAIRKGTLLEPQESDNEEKI